MATRLYLRTSGSPAISPAVNVNWESSASSFFRAPMDTVKGNTALTDKTGVFPSATTQEQCFAQFCSRALDVNQTITGTCSLVVRGLESALTADANLSFVLRVMTPAGVQRGALVVALTTGSTEYGTSAATRTYNATAVTSVAALAGDFLVLEVGLHGVTPDTATTQTLRFGDPSATADFALTDGLTTDLVPWVELSQTITFVAAGTTLVMSVGQLTVAGLAPKVPRIVQIPTGSLTLSGLAPKIPRIIRPGVGQLVLAGLAPKIPRIVRPGVGQIVIAGLAPKIPRIIRPGVGQIVMAGLAPSIPRIVRPGIGQLIVAGLAPKIPRIIRPGTGQLLITGLAPQIPRIIRPAPGQLILTGFAPIVVAPGGGGGSPTILLIPTGHLILTGFAPSILVSNPPPPPPPPPPTPINAEPVARVWAAGAWRTKKL